MLNWIKSPQRQNSVFNTSYGPIAANLPEFAVYAQASYVERLEYRQHKFKMTFNIQNGTDLDMLRQSAIEKCALAFEDNRDFVDCQIINLCRLSWTQVVWWYNLSWHNICVQSKLYFT